MGSTSFARVAMSLTSMTKWLPATFQHFVIEVSDIATLAKEVEPMKRNVVSIVGRFCDPIGFV